MREEVVAGAESLIDSTDLTHPYETSLHHTTREDRSEETKCKHETTDGNSTHSWHGFNSEFSL
jgi:hypothetical protein